MEKIYYSWEETGLLIQKLIKDVKDSNIQYNGVYGLPKGGLPIAVSLAYALNLPLLMHSTEETLLVDDISDTGVTLKNHKHKNIACLFSTCWTETIPDFYVAEKERKDQWVVFPWDENAKNVYDPH
jgi:hypoxanthine phosphoribosyltransferase